MPDTYSFTFNYESTNFSSTKNGSSVDQYVMGLTLPYLSMSGSNYTWSGTFGNNNTTIFGPNHLNSYLTDITLNINTNTATFTLANGTVLTGTGSYDGEYGTFYNMQITSGGGGGSATQLNTPTASASCTASGVLTITGLNDANADGYKVKYWNNTQTESNAATATLTVSSGSATLNLTTGYSYTIKVQAVGDGTTYSDSEWSSAVGPIAVGVTLAYPTSLATSSVTSSGFYTSWASVTGASSYKLRYSTANMNQWTEIPTSNTFYTLSGLLASTSYDIQVKAIGNGTNYSDSDWCPKITTTTSAASISQLPAPSGFTISLVDDDVIVTGLNVANAVGYVLKFGHTNDPGYTETNTLTASNGTVTYEDFSQQYAGQLGYPPQVKAVGDGTNYTDSDYASGTAVSRLSTPTNFSASYSSSGYVHTVTGLNVANASGYKIRVNHTNTADSISGVLTASGGTITYTDSVDFEVGEATIQVMAVGDGTSYSDSEWSAAVSPSTLTQLATPTGFTAVYNSVTNTHTISGLNVANAVGYQLSIYHTYSQSVQTDTLTATDGVITYTDANGFADGEDSVRIKAIGDGINYTNSEWSASFEPSPYVTPQLSAPSGFTATYANGVYTMSGVNVANAVGYKIWYTNDDSGVRYSGTVTATNGVIEYTPSVSDYWAAPDGYADNIRLQAIGDGINYTDSDWSTAVNIVVITPLSTPTITATGGDGQIVVSGLNVANATSYDIGYQVDGASEWTTLVSVVPSAGSYTITGLSTPEDYNVRAKAKSSSASYTDSDWSTIRQASTAVIPTLDAPTLTSTATTTTSITLGGLSVSNANSYLIRYKTSSASEWTEITPTVVQGAYTLSNLAVETTYQIQGKSISSNHANYQDSDWSTPALEVTTDYVPVALTAPTITATTNDRHSIVVSGLNDANATGYVLSYSVHGDDNWITTNTVQAVSGSYTLSGLTVETAYDIKAKAIGNGAKYLDSPFSEVVTGETAAMAGSTGGIFRPIETTSTMLSDIEVESGQFIICTDTRKLYYDCSTNTRIELQ